MGFREFEIKVYEGIKELELRIPEAVIRTDDLYRVTDAAIQVRGWSWLYKRFRKPVCTLDGCLLGLITNGGRKLMTSQEELNGIEGFAFGDSSMVLQAETRQHQLVMQFENARWGVKGRVDDEPLSRKHGLRALLESARIEVDPGWFRNTPLNPAEFTMDLSQKACRIRLDTAVAEHETDMKYRNVVVEITDWEALKLNSADCQESGAIYLGQADIRNLTQEDLEETSIDNLRVERPGVICFTLDIRDQTASLRFSGARISAYGEYYGEFCPDCI